MINVLVGFRGLHPCFVILVQRHGDMKAYYMKQQT